MSELAYDVFHKVRVNASRAARVLAILSSLTLGGDIRHTPSIINPALLPAPLTAPAEDNEIVNKQTAKPVEILDQYLNSPSTHPLDDSNRRAIELLENNALTDKEFADRIKYWTAPYPIFPYLHSLEAKSRFIKYVLDQDDLNKAKYQTQDNGPDANNDGEVTLVKGSGDKIYNELGQIVNENSFVCSDFAKEMSLRYGIKQRGDKPVSLQLPLFTISLRMPMNPGLKPKTIGGGHSFNGIFLGDSVNDLLSRNNWIFIEPQTDQVVNGPMKHLVDGRALQIRIPGKYLTPEPEDMLAGFVLLPNTNWQPINGNQAAIFIQLENQVFLNGTYSEMGEENLNHLDFSNIEPNELESTIKYLLQSDFFSLQQIRDALKNASLPPNYDLERALPTLAE